MHDLPDDLAARCRLLNADGGGSSAPAFVLCWLQQALRAVDNPILDVAVLEANRLGLPVLVYHGLGRRYPHASHRLHRFALEASRSLGPAVRERGLAFARFVEEPESQRRVVDTLAEQAALVVTDDHAAFVARTQAANLATRTSTPVLAVDAARLVPYSELPGSFRSSFQFRKKHTPLWQRFLERGSAEEVEPSVVPYEGELPFEPTHDEALTPERIDEVVERCGIDMTVPPAPDFEGTRDAAETRLAWALEEVLPSYNFRRNNPADPAGGSRLSPWLHFGVLGPRELARAVREADVHPAASDKYLDELLTWREFFHHLVQGFERPDAYENLPDRALETLEDHACDPRPVVHDLETLIHGETEDETWNAAQKQFLYEGYLHNNLRMYWGTKILEWCAHPKEAWETIVMLNDRFSLDGRDPATYGNLQACFGRGKPGPRETPIYGNVARKSDAAVRKRPGVREWIEGEARRDVFRVAVPS